MPPDIPGFYLERLLGRGASEVWLAWSDRPEAGPVALKHPAPGAAGAGELAWEAAALAALDHPNLMPVLAVEEGPVLVLPFLPGGSLRDLLDDRGTLTAGEVVAIFRPVASAVDALHRIGLVHGDLKPDNVLLDATGTPVLADLGCARNISGAPSPPGLPVAPDRLRAGTSAYLDPGLFAGGPAAVEADVFALGATAYELLTGRCPHRGEPAELLAAAAAGVHRPLGSWPGVAEAVGHAVEAALDPNPARRPSSATALVALLAKAVDPGDVVLPGPARRDPLLVRPLDHRHRTRRFGPAPPPTALTSPAHSPVRRRIVVVIAAGVLAMVSAVVAGAPSSGPAGPCPRRDPMAGPGRALAVDVDGDGCTESARWHAAVLAVDGPGGPRSYLLGRPGDQVLTGDWDGDGSVTVAVYRPSTGRVLYVDRFPEDIGQQVTARRTTIGTIGGRAHVERGGGGRPVVRVDPPD